MQRRRLIGALLGLATCGAVHAQDRIRIANEGGIRDAWTLAPGAQLPVPAYPQAYAANEAETCIAIGYLLNADGTTSDFALLKSWSAAEPQTGRDAYWAAFAQDASSALARWKFVPRPGVDAPQPVYTVATFLFDTANPAELRGRCAIPNLATHLVQLRQDTRLARTMSGHDVFARLDIDPALEQRYLMQERQRRDAMQPKQTLPTPMPMPQPTPSPQSPAAGG